MISAIPISTFTPAITTPRQTSAGMLSDWNLEWLADTGLPYAKGIPRLTTRERRIRSCQMYKSVLKKGEAPSGPT
jgi:uncharacterized protein (DUF1684 family)